MNIRHCLNKTGESRSSDGSPLFRRIKRIVFWLAIAALGWCCILGAWIVRYGTENHAAASDCIIVLGAAVQGDEPSPVFEERIRHAISLHQQGFAPRVIFTGGFSDGKKHSESGVGASMAADQGIPPSDVLIEQRSHTTMQNLSAAHELMEHHGMESAIIVSDPLHMKRAVIMAEDLDIEAVSSPTPTTRYRSFSTQFKFLLREIYFFHHYIITGN